MPDVYGEYFIKLWSLYYKKNSLEKKGQFHIQDSDSLGIFKNSNRHNPLKYNVNATKTLQWNLCI